MRKKEKEMGNNNPYNQSYRGQWKGREIGGAKAKRAERFGED